VKVIQRAKERIGELSELKNHLQSFKDSSWVDQMKKQFYTHKENAGNTLQDSKDLDEATSSSEEDDDIKVGDMICGVPLSGFNSVTFDEANKQKLNSENALIDPPAPEIISHRLY
jgi:hypothetical protein